MNLRTFNFPPGVSLRDLDDQGADPDEIVEQLNQKADLEHERAKDDEIMRSIYSAE